MAMTTVKKAALGFTGVLVLAVGIELAYLHHRNEEPAAKPVATQASDPDDLIFLKHEHPDTLKDAKDLKGRTLWISAGGQMDYYPFNGKTADYGKSQGVLLGAEPVVIQDAVEQVAPKTATFRIPGGEKQVLLVFTKPGSDAKYAVPVGYRENGVYTYSTDEIFFYDDPHTLYAHWGPAIWKSVDAHEATVGMNERQVQLALGQVSKSLSNEYGNRLVVYANLGKPIAVTFVKNKVTAFRADQGF